MRWFFFATLLWSIAGVQALETAAPRQPAAGVLPVPEELPRFDVLEYEVEGNSVLPTIEIERAVYKFLGPHKTINDVEAARSALERAYQKAGYLTVLVDIPEQKVDSGVVRLRVTEGKVGELRVSGNRYYSRGYIRSKVPSLAAGTVPNFTQVQKELAQLNRNADRRVTPVLRPGTTPGTVEAELKVDDSFPLHGGIELNNRKSPNTDELRLQGFLRYDNLWQREHSAAIQYVISPQDTSQVKAVSGTYVLPAPWADDVIAFYAVHSDSNEAAIGGLTVLGKGDIVGARYIIPLRQTESLYQSLTLGADYKHFDQNLAFGTTEPISTPLSYVPFIVQYGATFNGKHGVTQGTVSANFAPRGLFDNQDPEFENNRFGARASYFYVRGELSREQTLPYGMTLFARLGGQTASQPLVSNEQFVAGGVDTVRGYLEAEQSGDDAVYGRLELRSPSFGSSWFPEMLVLGFYDAASLHLQDALPGQTSTFKMSSAGVGLRLQKQKHLDATLDFAVPFDSAQITHAGDARLLFRVAYEF